MRKFAFLGVAVYLLISGCDDSKNPLSDPKTSKADEQLVGGGGLGLRTARSMFMSVMQAAFYQRCDAGRGSRA